MVVSEKEITSTARAVEHRIERLPIQEHPEAHLAEIVDKLNELGKQGWRVTSVDLSYHPSYSPGAQPGVELPVLLEKPAGSTRRLEYRIERMPFQEHPEKHLSELLARVSELGKQGWGVTSVDLSYHPSYSPGAQPGIALPVLMARET